MFWDWSLYEGNTSIKWQLEILPMDNNRCLSTPLLDSWNIFHSNCLQYLQNQVYLNGIALSLTTTTTTTTTNQICIINFNVKF